MLIEALEEAPVGRFTNNAKIAATIDNRLKTCAK
jgi:hypothetical protein